VADRERKRSLDESRQAGNEELTRSAEDLGAEPGTETGHAAPAATAATAATAETETWAEARAEMTADIDPEALTVMAEADAGMEASARGEFDANLARAQAGARQLAEQRARAQVVCGTHNAIAQDRSVSHSCQRIIADIYL